MATSAQLTANRINAAHSTGPRTESGKAASSRNSTRHGFRSQTVLLPGDDPAEYQSLLDQLTAHFRPVDFIEERSIREMADAEWRLRRARLYQEELLTARIEQLRNETPDAPPIALQARAFDLLHQEPGCFAQLLRHEARFERQYDRAQNTFVRYRLARLQLQGTLAASAPAATVTNEPNSPRSTATAPPTDDVQTPRNAACPCGSGLKYKRCCARNAPPVLGPASPTHPDLRRSAA